MRRSLLLLATLPAAAAPALAQAPKVTKSAPAGAARGAAETGAFVVRLGTDTVAVERWTRTAEANGTRIEGDVFNRTPSARVSHYVVSLDAAGRPTRMELRTRRPDGAPLPNTALGATYTFRGDSAFAEVRTAADTLARFAAPAPAGTIAALPNAYGLWELALRAARTGRRDSAAVSLWGPGAPRSQALPLRFVGRDSAYIEYFGDPLMLTVDEAGRIRRLDGARTTNKAVVERVADVDVAAVAQAFAARPAMGQTSPRDTVRAALGAAQLLVDYSRPSVRGRTVWGGTLVPFGQVWRAGANAATQLRTSADLTIGGTAVPAGTYTLFVLPNADGRHQLIVNKQTGQWGTEYNQAQDLARIPVTARTLAEPVEQFTIAVEPAGAGGTLALRWGTLELSAPVTVKP